MNNAKHEFALYVLDISARLSKNPKTLLIDDTDLVRRITSILRLASGDIVTLFDEKQHAQCTIKEIHARKSILFSVHAIEPNTTIEPTVTILLPLLKREAFEDMVYACVEFGATNIQLISTEKTQRSWHGEKELQRTRKIMIAAAEQSKQFRMCAIHEPRPLSDVLKMLNQTSIKLVADPDGVPLYDALTQIKNNPSCDIVITMGPEGDFTTDEKKWLDEASFQSVQLTSTVLRSQQAGTILLGAVRSIL